MNAAPILEQKLWRDAQDAHRQRILQRAGDYLEARRGGRAHPVYDFLFTYYSFRPAHLLAWSPGAGARLHDPEGEYPMRKEFGRSGALVFLDARRFAANRIASLSWTIDLLSAVELRAPVFGCNGLHEWAMVYRLPANRHSYPLRLDASALETFVEGSAIRCSHFDAFRFFSNDAKPLNRLQPRSEDRLDMEQGGCLHTNMDLYKWSAKFWPWIPSSLIADSFELAWDARTLDMRASPYDLSSLGFSPIQVETPSGRAEYEELQREISSRGNVLRPRLREALIDLKARLDECFFPATEISRSQ